MKKINREDLIVLVLIFSEYSGKERPVNLTARENKKGADDRAPSKLIYSHVKKESLIGLKRVFDLCQLGICLDDFIFEFLLKFNQFYHQ